jgi:predicted amidophosphoribosyltransferase
MAFALCKSGNCGYVTEDLTENGCRLCGSPLVKSCPKCGAEIKKREGRFCSSCTERLKDEYKPEKSVW